MTIQYLSRKVRRNLDRADNQREMSRPEGQAQPKPNLPRTGSVNVDSATCEPEAQEGLVCRPFIEEYQYDLAYKYTEGKAPLVVFCGGYRSDMTGTKAQYFEGQCIAHGQAYLRFDYSGHGKSEGDFNDGTIGQWAGDAIAILDHIAPTQPIILVGSSMGGWMAFLIAKARPDKVKALIGIAAAPDFTEDIYARLNDEQRDDLHTNGFAAIPNDYSDEPYHFPLAFYEEAKNHMILTGEMPPLNFPIHLFQGGQDKDVLPDTPDKIKTALPDANITITHIENGDHRLSTPDNLKIINEKIKEFST